MTGATGLNPPGAGVGGSTSNFVWPSGFTSEGQTFTFPMAEHGQPTMAKFMTSPATDMRLIKALENQAAYIEGNPPEDKDLELFYYRFVSDECCLIFTERVPCPVDALWSG